MNEFTKDELSILHDALIIAIDEYNVGMEVYSLTDKIKSMIDNYCEHQKTKQCNISEQVLCTDCGEEVH